MQAVKNLVRMSMTSGRAVSSGMKFIDVGANLTDEMYSGLYNGSKKHEPDLPRVLGRAWSVGVEKIVVTAGNLEDLHKSLALINEQGSGRLFTTVGVHPTRCLEFEEAPMSYIQRLKDTFEAHKGRIVALGEFGLDFERTKFCPEDVQKKYFALQLEELGPHTNLPLFLHCRGAGKDLQEILNRHKEVWQDEGGVVHSFDGSREEMETFVDEMRLHIGINGCSLRTEENLEVVRHVPVEKLLLETDAPWCGIRPTHASSKYIKTKFPLAKKNYDEEMMYKARNEPQTILNVLEVVAALKEMEPKELASIVYENTQRLFFKNSSS